MKKAFDELGLGTKAKANGGPNQCFQINHQDGPNVKRKENGQLPGVGNQYYEVCGKEYRVRQKKTLTSTPHRSSFRPILTTVFDTGYGKHPRHCGESIRSSHLDERHQRRVERRETLLGKKARDP